MILKSFSPEDWGCRPDMIVGLAPGGSPIVTSLKAKLVAIGYTVEEFSSDAAIFARAKSPGYGESYGKFCFGITIS